MGRILYNIRVVLASLVSFIVGIGGTALLAMLVAFFSIIRLRFVATLIIRFWSRFSFWIVLRRLHISGKEHIQKGKAYLVICNHGSYYDIPAIMAIQPEISWVARESLFRIPVLGYAMKQIGVVSIDAKNYRKSARSIELILHHAKNNRSVGIFPEGTRSPDGSLQEFKRGFIRILRNSELDILPVTLNGFYTLWKRGRFAIDPAKKLEIIVHEPIPRDKLLHLKDPEIIEKVKEIVRKDFKGW